MAHARNFGLDLARALAITMVLVAHSTGFGEFLGVGVDLFFVLSGFLIGRIFFRGQADAENAPGTFSLGAFWLARWLRTLPPYLAALLLYALANRHFHNNLVRWDYGLFLQNYRGVAGFAPSWSLCVEEHFYLALPLLGLFAIRMVGLRAMVWLLPVLALVPLLLRELAWHTTGLPTNWFWRSHLHAEGLTLGVWLAFLFVKRPELWQRLRWPALVSAVALPVPLLVYQQRHPVQPMSFQMVVFLLYAIGFAGVVRALYGLRWMPVVVPAKLLTSAIHGLALASYSIYLLHVLLLTDVRVVLDAWPRGMLKSGTIMAVSLLLSVAFYFLIERPSITLRDRLLRQTSVNGKMPTERHHSVHQTT